MSARTTGFSVILVLFIYLQNGLLKINIREELRIAILCVRLIKQLNLDRSLLEVIWATLQRNASELDFCAHGRGMKACAVQLIDDLNQGVARRSNRSIRDAFVSGEWNFLVK